MAKPIKSLELHYSMIQFFYNVYYYMANPVLGKFLCCDRFSLRQDFEVRTVSMKTVHPVYFSFGANIGPRSWQFRPSEAPG